MYELPFTLEPIDHGDLFGQILTLATINSARENLERNGVASPLRDIKLNASYAADLHSILLRVPATGKKLVGVIDMVHLKENGSYIVGVWIQGTISKLRSKGIDCSEFGFAIGKNRKVKLYYQFDWYGVDGGPHGLDGTELPVGLLTLDSIN
jgi:hypothetical protein